MLTKEQLRELAVSGVETLTIVVDDPEAYAASLAPDVDFTYGMPKEIVSLTTVNGEQCVSRSRSGMGWLRGTKPGDHLSVYVKSPAKVTPLVYAQVA